MSLHVEAWRIASDTPDYEAHDLTGKGAEITGGRWNRKGTPMVYAASSQALACLDSVVHVGGSIALPLNRYLVQVLIPISVWKARTVFKIADHVGWDAQPAGRVSLDWGTAWASGKTTALAIVPSVIVPDETNVLINPSHAGAAGIKAKKVRKWTYDYRIK